LCLGLVDSITVSDYYHYGNEVECLFLACQIIKISYVLFRLQNQNGRLQGNKEKTQ